MKHTDCQKKCIQLSWGRSILSVTAENTPLEGRNADVDLWYCEDHKTHFYHDWSQKETKDFNLELWRKKYVEC